MDLLYVPRFRLGQRDRKTAGRPGSPSRTFCSTFFFSGALACTPASACVHLEDSCLAVPLSRTRRLALFNFRDQLGDSCERSCTKPVVGTWKIGASGSLLMATMFFRALLPAKC